MKVKVYVGEYREYPFIEFFANNEYSDKCLYIGSIGGSLRTHEMFELILMFLKENLFYDKLNYSIKKIYKKDFDNFYEEEITSYCINKHKFIVCVNEELGKYYNCDYKKLFGVLNNLNICKFELYE